MPEDAVADMSLRFLAFCNALGERRSQRGRNCYYSIIYVCTRVHMLYNSQAPRGRPPLFYDHSKSDFEGGRKRGVLLYCHEYDNSYVPTNQNFVTSSLTIIALALSSLVLD